MQRNLRRKHHVHFEGHKDLAVLVAIEMDLTLNCPKKREKYSYSARNNPNHTHTIGQINLDIKHYDYNSVPILRISVFIHFGAWGQS